MRLKNIYEVCAEMEHSSIKVMEGYAHHANYFYKKEPYDWFKRVLKFHRKDERVKHVEIAKSKKVSGCISNPSKRESRCHPTIE